MKQFFHPSTEDITLTGVLGALSDPLRLHIVKSLMKKKGGMSCSEVSPSCSLPKSTLSNHFRVLREAGLVHTTQKGVEHRNIVRVEDIESRFPGLLKTILELSTSEYRDDRLDLED
jgi:DNA-binding transcriptional ArsR family regulator